MARKTKTVKSTNFKNDFQRLKQTDVPSCSIDDALKIAFAIQNNYAGKPVTPVQLARALNVQPTTGPFRMRCGASIAYGLTEGGYNASEIKLTPLGLKIVRPLEENGDLIAKREAFMVPTIISKFIKHYEGAQIPREDIGLNMLEQMGVPKNKTKNVFKLIIDSGESLGIITNINGKKYVDLGSVGDNQIAELKANGESKSHINEGGLDSHEISGTQAMSSTNDIAEDDSKRKRVFITHGKDKSFVEPIKRLLMFGELEPIVADERQSVSQPVPDKVLNDMRSCGAAIIHIDAEHKMMDQEGKEHVMLNPNVLIEVGAAMALYGRRFILLVKKGISLPSNLQGLFEVRYNEQNLDGEATIKLLEAINVLKTTRFPERITTN